MYDAMLIAAQRIGHASTEEDRIPPPSQTPMHVQQSHRDGATHNVIDALVTATPTIPTMSTLATVDKTSAVT